MARSENIVHNIEGKVYWTPSGGSEVELDVREGKVTFMSDRAESTGSGSNGFKTRKRGLRDISGSLMVIFRKDQDPYAAARSIYTGQEGSIRGVYYDTGSEFEGEIILGDIEDTIYSNEDIKVLSVPFEGNGEWSYPTVA